jgi:hypothetical protein
MVKVWLGVSVLLVRLEHEKDGFHRYIYRAFLGNSLSPSCSSYNLTAISLTQSFPCLHPRDGDRLAWRSRSSVSELKPDMEKENGLSPCLQQFLWALHYR